MEKNTLMKLIPEFNYIKNDELKEKSLLAFKSAIEESGWDENTINKCPISSDLLGITSLGIVEYTRIIGQVTNTLCEQYGDWIRTMNEFNEDYAIAAALLQSTGRLLEFTLDENGLPVRSESGKLYRYPWRAAYIAKEYVLPLEVVHTIVSIDSGISPGRGKVIKTAESVIVRNAEAICSGVLKKSM